MDGYEVTTMEKAAPLGDIFVTVTGNRARHRRRTTSSAMKDGALLANSGHFDVEINIKALRSMARERREVRAGVEEFVLPSASGFA